MNSSLRRLFQIIKILSMYNHSFCVLWENPMLYRHLYNIGNQAEWVAIAYCRSCKDFRRVIVWGAGSGTLLANCANSENHCAKTQLDFKAIPQYSRPFYWAPFVKREKGITVVFICCPSRAKAEVKIFIVTFLHAGAALSFPVYSFTSSCIDFSYALYFSLKA